MTSAIVRLLCLFCIVAQIFALPPHIPNAIENLPTANAPATSKELTLADHYGGKDPEVKASDTKDPQEEGFPDKLLGLSKGLAKAGVSFCFILAFLAAIDYGARFAKEWIPKVVNFWKEKTDSYLDGNEAGLVGTVVPTNEEGIYISKGQIDPFLDLSILDWDLLCGKKDADYVKPEDTAETRRNRRHRTLSWIQGNAPYEY